VEGSAAAACVSACLYLPIGIWVLTHDPVTLTAVARAAAAGVLCSAVPMVADLRALRRVPARFFGAFMSVNPAFAALTGLIVLGQSVAVADWLAIAAIVAANGLAVSQGAARHRPATGAAAGGAAAEILTAEALAAESLSVEALAVEIPGAPGHLTGRGR
jgi:inner membrane transporter RhtA